MNAIPLPSPEQARAMRAGYGRAAAIRRLRRERCGPTEIAEFLRVDVAEVRRTLHRPVPSITRPEVTTARDERGRWVAA